MSTWRRLDAGEQGGCLEWRFLSEEHPSRNKTQTLKVGDKAPDFELPAHRGGEKFKLSDLRGKKNAVLVFYVLDWTPV